MNTILSSWKSSLTGLLSFLTTTGLILLASGSNILNPTATKYVTLGLALARGYMALISKDPDKVMAMVPGSPTPQAVSAHPVPDNPAAKPVINP